MKKIYINVIITSLAVIIAFFLLHQYIASHSNKDQQTTVGFIYVGDESTPYTTNFIHAEAALKNEFGNSIKIIVKNNVAEGNEGSQLRSLVKAGCDIIFTTSYGYSEIAKKIAGEYPNIQFCQATGFNANDDPVYSNYHTFMGEIYQGRYISGIVAGMKLAELIDEKKIDAKDAKVGYVAAYPYAEVISGYTAFILGVRSVVPEATMTVKYVNTWSSYSIEKGCAKKLIDEGCIIISQHSDTTGPAVACEETDPSENVFHIGYNQSMSEVAPTTSLISCRINWKPYIIDAVKAVRNNEVIENSVKGNVNGNDIGAGFDEGWVEMLELNNLIAAKNTKGKINEAIEAFKTNQCQVFKGNYIGVNPANSNDTYDLSKGYDENATSSAPTFNYILKDVITIE